MTDRGHEISTRIIRELGRAKRRYLSFGTVNIVATRVLAAVDQTARFSRARYTYETSALASEADTLFLARIVGNDLEPRHKKGQSLESVEFILENEPAFPNCTKYWILNRIVDPAALQCVVDLLERHRQQYKIIPFDRDEYRRVDWDLGSLPRGDYRFTKEFEKLDERGKLRFEAAIRRKKNLYIMNNNGARNVALFAGRARAKWVLPWDGNCFLTQSAFDEICATLRGHGHIPYFLVPMTRVASNQRLLAASPVPDAAEEPQVIIRRDAREIFNEEIPYGRRPKVELFWRLGVPGPWDRYDDDPWDPPRPPRAPEQGLFKRTGWVARLASGRAELEVGKKSGSQRGLERDFSIMAAVDNADSAILGATLRPHELAIYDEDAIGTLANDKEDPTNRAILDQANLALDRGPYSVVDKGAAAPSGDPHDYFHPAPYWWPDPSSETGLPYVQRDGVQVPGTELYHPQSGQFDRTRLQLLFDDTLNLALAWRLTGGSRYAEHGARLIRTWFLDERTKMNPHLLYAQVRLGHNANLGTGRGIIEFKDVFYFLDAVRLIERSKALAPKEIDKLRAWFQAYATWLDTEPAAIREFRSRNNHGVFFDLQRAAIASFLGDGAVLNRIRLNSRERLHGQVAADGSLPEELARTRPRHYELFTLQGWTNLARLMSSIGDDLWNYRTADGRGIELAIDWLIDAMADEDWPGAIDEVETERLAPLVLDRARHYGKEGGLRAALPMVDVFDPSSGIPPYWSLWRI